MSLAKNILFTLFSILAICNVCHAVGVKCTTMFSPSHAQKSLQKSLSSQRGHRSRKILSLRTKPVASRIPKRKGHGKDLAGCSKKRAPKAANARQSKKTRARSMDPTSTALVSYNANQPKPDQMAATLVQENVLGIFMAFLHVVLATPSLPQMLAMGPCSKKLPVLKAIQDIIRTKRITPECVAVVTNALAHYWPRESAMGLLHDDHVIPWIHHTHRVIDVLLGNMKFWLRDFMSKNSPSPVTFPFEQWRIPMGLQSVQQALEAQVKRTRSPLQGSPVLVLILERKPGSQIKIVPSITVQSKRYELYAYIGRCAASNFYTAMRSGTSAWIQKALGNCQVKQYTELVLDEAVVLLYQLV